MKAVFFKNIRSFFSSGFKVASLGAMIIILNIFLWYFRDTSILVFGYADLTQLFDTVPYVLLFLIPAVSMNLFVSDVEQRTGDLLYAKPISIFSVWTGHFLSVVFVLLVFLILTSTSYISIIILRSEFSSIDHGQILSSYLGVFFLGSVFTALSLFCNTLVRSQAAAFLLGIISCYTFFILPGLLSELQGIGTLSQRFLDYLSLDSHYVSMGKGLLEIRSVVYFFSLILLLSVLGVRNVLQRWV